MDLVRRVTEAEVVAEFLRAELASHRFGPRVRELLGGDDALVTRPHLDDRRENAERADVLDRYRGWLRREGLFHGLPTDLDWYAARATRDELLSILFIDWDWWLTLSGGTRRPLDAARRIRAGEVPGADPEADEAIALALGRAPRLIALAPPDRSTVVLLEGHVRLTAYALYPEHLPDAVEILLGLSERIAEWSLF